MKTAVLAAAGLSLGVVVAYLTWVFVTRLTSYSVEGLAAVVGVLLGGTVVGFIGRHMRGRWVGFASYAIGLLVGSIVYSAAYTINHGGHPYTSPPAHPTGLLWLGDTSIEGEL